ncbi:MAG: NADH-quinone oxidoreductase subunit H [Bdellovibrionaceae bacterium]|nr:NADH-quinone oxidoreductase subunit H [Pseudobdellovibrionaceae bacterium]|tara:strand:+ start:153889 stop:155004 length:1116 start_codon:yes stop_codon:yes gene_type:complete
MGADLFEIGVNTAKLLVIFLMMVQIVPLLVWVERRGSAYIQNRFGPNRVGPLGLTQLLADAVKFIFKEEFIPDKNRRFIFYAAPVVALIPGALAFAAIPLSIPISVETFELFGQSWGPYTFLFQGYEVGIGIVFVLGVSSLGAYALLMAGYGSSNKYSMFGALRASAQMISYELALGLSLVGILLIFNTFDFQQIIDAQKGQMVIAGNALPLPNWGIFYQPIGFILFVIAVFAETNRLPFDLPEAESELVAGYHTEYGGIKMNMFYIGEYGHMLVASGLMVTFYFGGYNLPWFLPQAEELIASYGNVMAAVILHLVFLAKVGLFLWIFVWVRWTIPRFRYDQLMDLGWKTMLPWALANTIITAIVVFWMRS